MDFPHPNDPTSQKYSPSACCQVNAMHDGAPAVTLLIRDTQLLLPHYKLTHFVFPSASRSNTGKD
ncbi:MAG: hypothetical protein ACTXOO_02145 [Sodalis sp. (in: enterobacteria)]